ncbi:unnamed protein product [Symbiodinium sp. CCMP2592]|nr:unnamed protein product [Symbiodinium sp. CCMP2592]
MSGGGRYTPILPLFLIGCGLLWLGGALSFATRTASPSWHRRERRQRRKLRKKAKQGRATRAELRQLANHHGTMPPKAKPDAKAFAKGRGKGQEASAQASRIDFGLPAAMMTALQAITARSTQDLWSSPSAVAIDMSVEQQISKAATASHKLSKRIAGDVKAKDELSKALSEWTSAIGLHLVGLVQRVQALSAKVDEDLIQACQEMRQNLTDLPSSTTEERIAQASQRLGPIWPEAQSNEILRIAASLRAFSTVQSQMVPPGISTPMAPGFTQMGAPSSGLSSGPPSVAPAVFGCNSAFGALSTGAGQDAGVFGLQGFGGREHGGTPMLGGAAPDAGDLVRHRRWKRGGVAVPHRPSKSPRREESADALIGPAPTLSAGPWCMDATGRSPDATRRPSTTTFSDDTELIPDGGGERACDGPVSWRTAWLQAVAYVVANGGDPIGELDTSPEQDAVWPLQTDDTATEDVQAEAATFWKTLGVFMQQAQDEQFPGMVASCQELLQRIRLCPSSLPGIQQGVLVAIHVTLGNILDFQQYGPATAQEWLYPSLLLEHGCECRGMIPRQMSDAMRPLLSIPCPYLVTPSLAEDFGEI